MIIVKGIEGIEKYLNLEKQNTATDNKTADSHKEETNDFEELFQKSCDKYRE